MPICTIRVTSCLFDVRLKISSAGGFLSRTVLLVKSHSFVRLWITLPGRTGSGKQSLTPTGAASPLRDERFAWETPRL